MNLTQSFIYHQQRRERMTEGNEIHRMVLIDQRVFNKINSTSRSAISEALECSGNNGEDEEDESASRTLNVEDKSIVATFPTRLRDKAAQLLLFLKKRNVYYDEDGHLYHQGQAVPNSNYTDLLHATIRDRTLKSPPMHFGEFLSLLKALNVPTELIGNAKALQASSEGGKRERNECVPRPVTNADIKRHKSVWKKY